MDVARELLSAALGGLLGLAWSQVAFGNRLTRLETKVEQVEDLLKEVRRGAQQLAGRRRWPHEGAKPK